MLVGLKKQVAAVVGGCVAEVVRRASLIKFHPDDAQPGVHEILPHMRHVGYRQTIENTIGGVRDRFIEAMFRNPERSGADVEFTDVDGVERTIPGMRSAGKNIILGDGIVMQGKIGDILLMGIQRSFFSSYALVPEIGDKECVVVRTVLDFAQRGNHFRFVAVADVVFFTPGNPCSVFLRCQRGFSRVDICAVGALG